MRRDPPSLAEAGWGVPRSAPCGKEALLYFLCVRLCSSEAGRRRNQTPREQVVPEQEPRGKRVMVPGGDVKNHTLNCSRKCCEHQIYI